MAASERATQAARDTLAKIAAYDPSFYKPSESILMAWAEHIALKNISREDMLSAVTKFYESNTDGMKPLPGSISSLARQMRQDRMMRGVQRPPEDKSDDPALPAAPGHERITLAEWKRRNPDWEQEYPGMNRVIGRSVPDGRLSVPCRHCHVPVGAWCTVPGTRDTLTQGERVHHCRLVDAGLAEGE